jgi:hypothetical protein
MCINESNMSEGRCQKSEARSQKLDVRSRKSEQMSEVLPLTGGGEGGGIMNFRDSENLMNLKT